MVVDIRTGKTVQEISFFTKEPLGFAESVNFYVYADGDSVNFVDVSGLFRFAKNVSTYVSKAIQNINWTRKMINAYKNLFGITEAQFHDAIKNGSGPVITMDLEGRANANCSLSSRNIINLNSHYTEMYLKTDNVLGTLFITTTIGHELAHYFDWIDGKTIYYNKYNDAGHHWERIVNGATIWFHYNGSYDLYY